MKLNLKHLWTVAAFWGATATAQASQATTYTLEVQQVLQQTDASSIAVGYNPFAYDQYALVAKVDTGGTNLSAAPILDLPGPTASFPTGTITFPTMGTNFAPTYATGYGYNRYQYGEGWTSMPLLNSVYGSGTFAFTLGNATAQPTLPLDTVNPAFPITPMLTSGGTWSGGALQVDPAAGATLSFDTSSFTGYTNGLGGQIGFLLFDSNTNYVMTPSKSLYAPSIGKTDAALTSLTIAPGTLAAGETYTLQVNYTQIGDINTNFFTGTGITGDPIGASYDTTSTFITIAAIPEPSTACLFAVAGTVGWLARLTARSRRQRKTKR